MTDVATTFSAVILITKLCTGGEMTADYRCPDGSAPIETEIHLLSGHGMSTNLFDDSLYSSSAIERAQKTEFLLVVKQNGKTILTVPRDVLDDKTIAALWSTLSFPYKNLEKLKAENDRLVHGLNEIRDQLNGAADSGERR